MYASAQWYNGTVATEWRGRAPRGDSRGTFRAPSAQERTDALSHARMALPATTPRHRVLRWRSRSACGVAAVPATAGGKDPADEHAHPATPPGNSAPLPLRRIGAMAVTAPPPPGPLTTREDNPGTR